MIIRATTSLPLEEPAHAHAGPVLLLLAASGGLPYQAQREKVQYCINQHKLFAVTVGAATFGDEATQMKQINQLKI